METTQTLLTLLAAISGLLLSWLTHRRQDVSAAVATFKDVNQALKEANERLGREAEQWRKRYENEMLRRVTLEEKLEIDRKIVGRLIEQIRELGGNLDVERLEKEVGCEG